ncbi:MAG: ABC transporter substrate-binding protein [Acidimicrobiales bacterium]
MLSSRRFGRIVAVLLALVLVASACGGGDDGGSTDSSGSDTTAAPTDGGDDDVATDDGVDETADGSDAVTSEDVEAKAGGTLRIGMQTEAGSLNPTNTGLNRGPIMLATAVFDTLTLVDANGDWQNNLTESWTPSDDLSSWDATLRDGITFTDGNVMNADAVIRTIEAFLADPLTSLVFKPAFDPDNPIEKVDEMTFRINASGPSSAMPFYFSTQLGMIGSPAWLDARDADPGLDQTPIGSGPFLISERTQDQKTVVVRNENWWRTDQEIFLDSIEFFPNSQDASRTDQFLVGDLDITHGTDAESIIRLREETGFTRVEDQSGEEFNILMNAEQPPFDDIRVRQAATHAFPKAQYMDFINEGTSLEADTLFSIDTPWHVPSIEQPDDMPELSGPLIESYCGDNPDNCTDGKVNIEYQHDGPSLALERIATLVTDAWSPFFNVEVQVIPNDAHINEVIFGLYDSATWRYHGFPDPDIDSAFLTCSTITALSINWSRNCNEERDALFLEQRSTEDFDERYAIWAEIQENLRDSYQYITITHTNWMVAANETVGGLCDGTAPGGAPLPCQDKGVVYLPQLFMNN